MKQIFLIFTCICSSLFNTAQTYNADVSITSVTLVSADKITTGTIADPNLKNLPTISPNNNIRVIPGTEKPLPVSFKGRITVHNDSTEQSNETILIVILPPFAIGAGSITPNSFVYRASSSSFFDGYIQFNLGKMAKGQTITVEFGFNRFQGYPGKVCAFIFSTSTDPNFRNNMKEANF